MKVVLTADVPRVGHKHEVKEVSSGYASNFLLPRGLAIAATPKALSDAKLHMAKREADKKIQEDLLHKNLKSLESVKITLKEKANEEGHLYSKVSAKEISNALKSQAHVDFAPEYIVLDEAIKAVGEHRINVAVGESKGHFTLLIEAIV